MESGGYPKSKLYIAGVINLQLHYWECSLSKYLFVFSPSSKCPIWRNQSSMPVSPFYKEGRTPVPSSSITLATIAKHIYSFNDTAYVLLTCRSWKLVPQSRRKHPSSIP
ncbi:hypothetical protein ACMFMG_010689 [Clarireedia jacksonii]